MFMKNHVIFKIAAIALVIAMLFTVAGCKKNSDDEYSSGYDIEYVYVDGDDDSDTSSDNASSDEDKASETQSGGTASSGGAAAATVVNNCYTSGTKIAKDAITFNIMIRDYNGGATDYNNSSFAKYVKEKMNITLKFEVCTESNFQEKMTLAYASNKLPDMFWGMAPATTFHNPYIKKGQLKEVGTLIEKYAPNIQKMYEENPSAEYLATFDDGKSYMIPMVNANDKYGQMLFINKTWLSNLKLSVPSNVDDLYNVLKKFKSEDANNNGNRNDEIPMMVAGEIDPSLYGPWGTNTYWNGFSIDDSTGKVYYGYTSEAYRNAMKYFNKLFKEGLLDNNLRGTTASDIYTRSSASVQTVGVFAASSYSGYVSDESFQKNYVVMPLLSVDGTNAQYYYNTYENVWAEWTVITSACKYPECAVRLVDSFYSTEGTLLARYGAPGSDGLWNYDSNGKIVFNLNKMPSKYKTVGDWIKSRTPAYGIPHYASQEFYALVNNANAEQNAATKYEQTQVKAIYSKVDKENSFPKLYLTDAQVAESKNKVGDYSTLRSDMFWKFLSGTSSLDNDWDTYVSQMNRLGLQEAVSIQQSAYNSYKAWLKKNG